jgi:CHAD domain-containing protein
MSGPSELLIRQRLRALTRALPEAQQGSPASVHQARVATRRLREALPLVVPGPAGRKLRRRVRRLTGALGPVRELDVALQMLEEFETAGELSRAGIVSLRHVIAEERQRLLEQLAHSVEKNDVDRLSRKAIAAAQACDARPSSTRRRAPAGRMGAARRAARRAARLSAAIENAAGIYLPDRLHEVRIAVKKLRYSVEIAEAYRGARGVRQAGSRPIPAKGRAAPLRTLRTLKHAQVLLGRMHDLEVLIARTRAVQGSRSAPNLRVSADLDRFVRRLEMECRQLHAQYIALRPSLLGACADVAAKPGRRAPAA